MSEETVVRQCAPTLAGIKTGSLFPCKYEDEQQLLAEIREMNRILVPQGLCLLPARHENGPALLYLYRPLRLQQGWPAGCWRRPATPGTIVPAAWPVWCSVCAAAGIFPMR